jgi:NTP pyrophosphatase (non-canonical NTP hydrolase)
MTDSELSSGEQLDAMGMDAFKWTEGFLKSSGLENAGPDFQGLLLAWFANALERGRAEGWKNQPMDVNEIAARSNETAHAHGWWDQPRSFGEIIALIHSEASEALEEWRNNRNPADRYYTVAKYRPEVKTLEEHLHEWANALDTHGEGFVIEEFGLPEEIAAELVVAGFLKPEGIPSELADIVIRVGDTAYECDIDLGEEILLKMAYNATRPYKHGGKRS